LPRRVGRFAGKRRPDRRRREERALDAYDRRRVESRDRALSRRRDRPAFGAARLARLAATGESAEALCRAPPILDVAAPEPALVDAFAARRERFVSLYRALRPEFIANAAS